MRQYSCEEAFQDTETKAATEAATEAESESESVSELKPLMEGGAGALLRAEIYNSGGNPTDTKYC